MSAVSLTEWLLATPGVRFAPLFDADGDLIVRTQVRGRTRRRKLLRRHEQMEQALIEVVEAGLAHPDWLGLIYLIAWGTPKEPRPLYIGMARREGRKHPMSNNLVRIRSDRSKFARWGDGNAYHIGDLSQALFGFEAYKGVEAKYESWANTLFVEYDPPRLVEPVMLAVIPWWSTSVSPRGDAARCRKSRPS